MIVREEDWSSCLARDLVQEVPAVQATSGIDARVLIGSSEPIPRGCGPMNYLGGRAPPSAVTFFRAYINLRAFH
ncbi:hypothetical protein QQF64_018268 [Cirrhinus molitorella]|uniref:Uncharacterized protein n=1 Tax=Cirrhinus molitorella TaxID=172907 RepID=A0ABR3LC40_9TELE